MALSFFTPPSPYAGVERAGGGVAGDVGAGLLHRAVVVGAVAGHDDLGVELQEAGGGVLRAGDAGLHAVTGELRVEVPRRGARRRCAEEADCEGGGRGRDADPAAERPVGGGAGGEHRSAFRGCGASSQGKVCAAGDTMRQPRLGATWHRLALRMERVDALVRTGPAGWRGRPGRPGRARIRPGSTRPWNTSAGAPARMPPSSSARSSRFMAGSITASDVAISSGGMEPTMAWWMPSTASKPTASNRAGMSSRSSKSWWAR